jgi:hypothetical protein
MEKKINEILSAINEFYHYDDQTAKKYIALLYETLDLIGGMEAKPTSMLDNAIDEAIISLRNELGNRMNENFFHSSIERRKNEFKISKMLVSVAIGNVLTSMQPAT